MTKKSRDRRFFRRRMLAITKKFKGYGFTVEDMKELGFEPNELRQAGYSPAELRAAGAIPQDTSKINEN